MTVKQFILLPAFLAVIQVATGISAENEEQARRFDGFSARFSDLSYVPTAEAERIRRWVGHPWPGVIDVNRVSSGARTNELSPVPPSAAHEWGQINAGARVSLKMDRPRYRVKEPVTAVVSWANLGTHEFVLLDQPVLAKYQFSVLRDRELQESQTWHGFRPDEFGLSRLPAVLPFGFAGMGTQHVERLNLADVAVVDQPGHYVAYFKVRVTDVARSEGTNRYHREFTSNTASFEVYAEPGDEVPDPSEENNADTPQAAVDAPSTIRAPDAPVPEASATTTGADQPIQSPGATPVPPSGETGAVAHDTARLGVMFWVYGALILALIGGVIFLARR